MESLPKNAFLLRTMPKKIFADKWQCKNVFFKESNPVSVMFAHPALIHLGSNFEMAKKIIDFALSINIKKRGRPTGRCRKLTPEKEKALKKAIGDKTPDQLKSQFSLWSHKAVQQLIKRRYSNDMPIRVVGEYLSIWRFTPQKPSCKAYERTPSWSRNGLIIKEWVQNTADTLSFFSPRQDEHLKYLILHLKAL